MTHPASPERQTPEEIAARIMDCEGVAYFKAGFAFCEDTTTIAQSFAAANALRDAIAAAIGNARRTAK